MKVDVVARFTHIWKTGVVVTALLATVVACGNSDSSRARNAALVAGTSCTKPGAVSKISKVSVVCAKTNTGNIWYPTKKSYGRSVVCIKSGVVRKKKSVVWVCGVVKSKKLWLATSPLPPAVLQATAVVAPGVSEPVPVLESTEVATPSRPVVADNNVLANPTIADEPPVTTPVTIATIPSAPVTIATVPSAPPIAPILYKVGEIGPGGGTVFYAAIEKFPCGATLTQACNYLEVAPLDTYAWQWATTAANCYAVGSTSGTSSCETNSIYSGDSVAQDASRTAAIAIGMGMANTNQIYARLTAAGSVETKNYAAGIAWEYTNNSKTDWYLPSKDELNELCKFLRNAYGQKEQAVGSGTLCVSYSQVYIAYYSSSEIDGSTVLLQSFGSGNRNTGAKKYLSYETHVRPVRAF